MLNMTVKALGATVFHWRNALQKNELTAVVVVVVVVVVVSVTDEPLKAQLTAWFDTKLHVV